MIKFAGQTEVLYIALAMTLPSNTIITTLNIEAGQLIWQVALILLIPLMLVFAFVIFLFYRQHRETHIRKQQMDLELKALRAQINPHFIFNCLNSIYYSILENKNQEAASYLLKFSWLTRRILENSDKRWISLSEDIEILQAYLDLEQMRADKNFTYAIDIDKAIDQEATSAIMLIVQPFVENSIWHGFQDKSKTYHIQINISNRNNNLYYEIIDNGTEHQQARKGETGKKRSMGTSIIADQLKSISVIEKGQTHLLLQPKLDSSGKHEGQRMELHYPLRELH